MDDNCVALNGFDYKIAYMSPTLAAKNFVKISKICVPFIGLIADNFDKEVNTIDKDTFVNIASCLNEDDIDLLMKSFFKYVQVLKDGRYFPLLEIVESHFQGKVFDMFHLLYECLKFNYSDFFTKALSKIPINTIQEKLGSLKSKSGQ